MCWSEYEIMFFLIKCHSKKNIHTDLCCHIHNPFCEMQNLGGDESIINVIMGSVWRWIQ